MNKQTMQKQYDFITKLQAQNCKASIEAMFLYYAAPLLCGAKPATMITLKSSCRPIWLDNKNHLEQASQLKTLELKKDNAKILLYIYEDKAIRQVLSNPLAKTLLARYGYAGDWDIPMVLEFLQQRFSQVDFPHEIGVLLGYPPEDVLGFIKNQGRNPVCSRYWKVYHNEKEARKLFARIDKAKHYACKLILQAQPINTVTKLLRAC